MAKPTKFTDEELQKELAELLEGVDDCDSCAI